MDNVLAISHDKNLIIEMIGMRFEIKNDKWGLPTRYLGAGVSLFTLPNGRSSRSVSSQSYSAAAVQTGRELPSENGKDLKTGKRDHEGHLPPGYKPEVDVADECDTGHQSCCQQMIGILRLAV